MTYALLAVRRLVDAVAALFGFFLAFMFAYLLATGAPRAEAPNPESRLDAPVAWRGVAAPLASQRPDLRHVREGSDVNF